MQKAPRIAAEGLKKVLMPPVARQRLSLGCEQHARVGSPESLEGTGFVGAPEMTLGVFAAQANEHGANGRSAAERKACNAIENFVLGRHALLDAGNDGARYDRQARLSAQTLNVDIGRGTAQTRSPIVLESSLTGGDRGVGDMNDLHKITSRYLISDESVVEEEDALIQRVSNVMISCDYFGLAQTQKGPRNSS
jgi:hypothetical protein